MSETEHSSSEPSQYIRAIETDPRLTEMATKKPFLEESEDDFIFRAYPSDGQQPKGYWTLHIIFNGTLVHADVIPRLDYGSPSHHDERILDSVISDWKRRLSAKIHVVQSPGVPDSSTL